MSTPGDAWSAGGLGKTRVEALTDGVFAIAMTLLVFGITIPIVPQGSPAALLQQKVLQLWPKFLTYGISFIMLGIYWVGHHNQFHYITRTDRTLLWINLLFLMSIGLIPFSTTLLGQYPTQRTAVVFYGANLIVVGGILYAHWRYATNLRRLVAPDIHEDVINLAKRRILVGPAAFLVAIGLSFFSTAGAIVLYALVPLLYVVPGRIDLHWRTFHRAGHGVARARSQR
jgi:TMEM175 potassium channel family protein